MEATLSQLIRSIVMAAILLATNSVPAGDQPAATQASKSPIVTVSGPGLERTEMRIDRLAELPRATVKVKEKEGEEKLYEAIKVADVLAAAGMKFRQSLRGERLADYLLVSAADG